MVSIYQQIQHNSGIPLGGIGTGTVEIRLDGLFHDWEMFNTGQWSPASPCACKNQPAMGPEDLIFILRVRTSDDEPIVRYLALREQLHDLYSLAWIRSVQGISFDGTFPVARIVYHDQDLPVEVHAEVFAPFVPLGSRTSGTPGFYVRFIVKNLISEPVEVSILGIMKNAVGYGQDARQPHNRLSDIDGGKAITFNADGLADGNCSTGDMTFAVRGGDISYITGAYREDHKGIFFLRGRYKYKVHTYLHQFRDSGQLPDLNAETAPQLPDGFNAAALSESERASVLDGLLQHPLFYDKHQRISLADPEMIDMPEFLDELADNLAQVKERGASWGYGALCSSMILQPEEEGESLFTVGWYFPNHISPTGSNIGHQYEHWFSGSLDVIEFLNREYAGIYAKTIGFADTVYDSSLLPEIADAIMGQVSTLTKCTWWTKAGHFGVWEGLGCCGFHTTDITYQGSFPIIALFPDLQKAQMMHGAQFQREDGRVHHFFTPDFSTVDNGFDRVDMNQQFVMLAARDYLWSGDMDYLRQLWPHIICAMENTALLDTDGDGLPDTDTRRNTYDAWDFTGCPSYISSLWLGALKAASRLADEIGDTERAEKWRDMYAKALESFDSKLWNGEYYVLWRDGDEVDECCMSDQMSGDWFSAVSGWGNILDPDRIKQALESIIQWNFRWNEGLINASYPPGKKPRFAAFGNLQADAPWTGIEYTVAALLLHYGMVAEGLAIVRDIHNRYLQAGRFWNHVECGGHYYRAMSSWTLLPALTGFKWDQPAGLLEFAPVIIESNCEYPFFTSGAWGTYHQRNGFGGRSARISISSGEISISTLVIPAIYDMIPSVYLNGKQLSVETENIGDKIRIKFESQVLVTQVDSFTVNF